jgi:hypothetical protein
MFKIIANATILIIVFHIFKDVGIIFDIIIEIEDIGGYIRIMFIDM